MYNLTIKTRNLSGPNKSIYYIAGVPIYKRKLTIALLRNTKFKVLNRIEREGKRR